jgi:predicted DCC family thiol-disulfide oxidoreductase YuxK
MSVAANQIQKTAVPDSRSGDYEIEVFFDGDCPLCRREVRMLKALDRKGRIRATDIAAEGFDPEPLGKTRPELMAEIHGWLPDGTWVKGVEVFRRLYAAVGCRTLARISRWPVISHTLDLGYRLFAKNRLRLTGRCDRSCSLDSKPVGGSEK